jgi:hypothetical protein
MKTIFFRTLLIVLLLSLIPASITLAHGEPTIIVEPAVVSPGEQITIIGADMEDGEVFKITLESGSGTVQLGEAIAIKDGEEAGFTAVFSIPNDLTAGFYLLRATTDEGETTAADLTIVSSTDLANAMTMDASAAQHTLDRSKPPSLIGSVIVLALLSASLGVWLIRKPE